MAGENQACVLHLFVLSAWCMGFGIGSCAHPSSIMNDHGTEADALVGHGVGEVIQHMHVEGVCPRQSLTMTSIEATCRAFEQVMLFSFPVYGHRA